MLQIVYHLYNNTYYKKHIIIISMGKISVLMQRSDAQIFQLYITENLIDKQKYKRMPVFIEHTNIHITPKIEITTTKMTHTT